MGAQAYLVNASGTEGSSWLGYTNNNIPIQPGGLLFYRGTTQYLFTQDSDGTNTFLGVRKSTDGKNWTPLDQAHRPVIGGFSPRVWCPATGNICTCYYFDGVSEQEYVTTFDLAGELFGTPLLTPYNTRDSGIIVRGSGDVVLAYAQNAAPQAFYISVYSGGGWTDIAVPALNGMAVLGMSLDKNGHVLLLVGDGTGDQLNLVLFDGSTVTVTSVLAFSDKWTSLGPGLYLPFSDQLIVPIKRSDDGSGNEGLSILIIANASTVSSSSSLVNVLSDTSVRGEQWRFPNISLNGGAESDLIFTWVATMTSPNSLILQSTSSDGGATWGSATTFYDPTIDNPVPLPTGSNFMIDVLGMVNYQGAFRTVLTFGIAPFSDEVYVITSGITALPNRAYIIDGDLASSVGQQYQFPSQHGPFRQDTGTFTVIERLAPPQGSTVFAGVYLAPTGTSSTEQDAANAPAMQFNEGFGVGRLGSILYLAYPNIGGGLSVKTFDMVAKVYGAAIDNPDTSGIQCAAVTVLSDGTVLIQVQLTGTDSVAFTTLSGGVFSAYSTMTVHGTVGTMVANGTVGHIWYGDFASPPQIQYCQYALGVLSGATATGAFGLASNRLYFGPAIYSSGRDELLVPFGQQSSGGPLGLLRGSPSVSPVWTSSLLVSPDPSGFFQVPAVAVDLSGNLYFAYRYDDASSGTATVSQVLYLTQAGGTGAWSTARVYYDFYVTPPVNSTVFLRTGSDPPTPPPGNFVVVEDQSGFATGVNSPAMSIAVLPGDSITGLPFSAVFAATTVFNPDANYYGDAPMLLTSYGGAPASFAYAHTRGPRAYALHGRAIT